MIKISGKVDKSNTYNVSSSNISFFIQGRTLKKISQKFFREYRTKYNYQTRFKCLIYPILKYTHDLGFHVTDIKVSTFNLVCAIFQRF